MLHGTVLCKPNWLNGHGFKMVKSCKYFKYRYDPVPNVHKYSNFSSYRKANTLQERKKYFEYKEFVRAKRNFKNLPNSWSDLYRSDMINDNWKTSKKKKKQWM